MEFAVSKDRNKCFGYYYAVYAVDIGVVSALSCFFAN
jgi:hypothetical protein